MDFTCSIFAEKDSAMQKHIKIDYLHYPSIEDMPQAEQELVAAAEEASQKAYAPYSKFKVGAAARLQSGNIIAAANSESEVFPSGMCAERALLYNHQTNYADDRILSLAIASEPSERECYPCGACRQVLLDVEHRQQSPIQIVMSGGGSAIVVESAKELLPFSFKL